MLPANALIPVRKLCYWLITAVKRLSGGGSLFALQDVASHRALTITVGTANQDPLSLTVLFTNSVVPISYGLKLTSTVEVSHLGY